MAGFWLWRWLLVALLMSGVAVGAEESKDREEEKPADLIDEAISAQTGISTTELRFMRKSMSRLNFVQSKLLELKNVKKAQFDAVPKLKHQRPEQLPILFEGDMLLTPRQMHAIVQNAEHQLFLKDIGRMDLMEKEGSRRRRFRRTLIANPVARWTEMPIPFTVATQHNANRSAVLNGVRVWEERTCLRFEEVNGTQFRPHIRFIRGSGCYSNVGRASLTGQILSVGHGCENPFIVAHEIGHALGFFHEQGRFDRDKYVRIQSDNIHVGFLNQFTKQDPQQIQTYGVEYDIGSVMHYDQYSFSSTGSPAIRTLDPNYQMTMGQRDEVTFNDVKKINSAYCSDKCSKQLKCQNSGYTDPLNCGRCRCPNGLGGKYCSRPLKTPDADKCGQLLRAATSTLQTIELSGPIQCNLIIRAADGAKIQLRIEELQFLPSLPCRRDYLELKYGKDFGTTGARFCSAAVPMRNIIAAANEAVVLYRSVSTYSKVKISYNSDEAPSPMHLFTNTLTIFSDFFRSIFHSTTFGQPNVEYDDKEEDEGTEETSQRPVDDVPIAVGLPKTVKSNNSKIVAETKNLNVTENITAKAKEELGKTERPVESTTAAAKEEETQNVTAKFSTVATATEKPADTATSYPTTTTKTPAVTQTGIDISERAKSPGDSTTQSATVISSTSASTPKTMELNSTAAPTTTIQTSETVKFEETNSFPTDFNKSLNETDIDDFPIPTAIDPLAELLSKATIDAVEMEFERVQKELTEKKNETEIVFITSEELIVKKSKAEQKVMIFEDNDLLWDALRRLRNGTAAITGKKNNTSESEYAAVDVRNVTEIVPTIPKIDETLINKTEEKLTAENSTSCKNPVSSSAASSVKLNETLFVTSLATIQPTLESNSTAVEYSILNKTKNEIEDIIMLNETTTENSTKAEDKAASTPLPQESSTPQQVTTESPAQHNSLETSASPSISFSTTIIPITSASPPDHIGLEGSGIDEILAEGFLVTAENIPTFSDLPMEYRRKPLRKPPKQQKAEILIGEIEGSGSGDFYAIIN